MMNEEKPGTKFWIGNGILALALLMLLFMGQLWQSLGAVAMALWVVLVGIGAYLLLNDKGESNNFPG